MATFHNFVNVPTIARSFPCTMTLSQLFPPSTLKRSNYSGTLTHGDVTPYSFKTLWSTHRTQHHMPYNLDSQIIYINHLMKLGLTFNKMFSTVTASESWNKLLLPRMQHVQHMRPALKWLKTMWNVWQGLCNTPHWPYTESTYLRHTWYLM
jgi:hypothetical protein